MLFQIENTNQKEHDLFYMSDRDKARELGCVGYFEGTLGKDGDTFISTWSNYLPELENKAFKDECSRLINILRSDYKYGILSDSDFMKSYCSNNGKSLLKNGVYGFKLFGIRCTYYLRYHTRTKDNKFYIYCYDNRYLQSSLSENTRQSNHPTKKNHER